jgi:N-acetylglucosamine-6-phosphate deacetylase
VPSALHRIEHVTKSCDPESPAQKRDSGPNLLPTIVPFGDVTIHGGPGVAVKEKCIAIGLAPENDQGIDSESL